MGFARVGSNPTVVVFLVLERNPNPKIHVELRSRKQNVGHEITAEECGVLFCFVLGTKQKTLVLEQLEATTKPRFFLTIVCLDPERSHVDSMAQW